MTIAAILDLETTGIDTATCEVVQCAVRVVSLPGCDLVGHPHVWRTRAVGPIPAAATAVHGITADDRIGAPLFCEVSHDVIKTCEAAGCELVITFNGAAFDLPILKRDGADITAPHFDVYRVWQVARDQQLSASEAFNRPRASRYTGALGAAYCWATGHEPLLTEHDAEADCEMTGVVGTVLLDVYGLERCLAWSAGPLPGFADFDSKIKIVDGSHVLAFSKHKGTALQAVDRGFLTWMLKGDFRTDTKAIVRRYSTQR